MLKAILLLVSVIFSWSYLEQWRRKSLVTLCMASPPRRRGSVQLSMAADKGTDGGALWDMFTSLRTDQIDAATVLTVLKQLFEEADLDGNLTLDQEELTLLMKRYYEMEKVTASWTRVENQVEEAIRQFDFDGRSVGLLLDHCRITVGSHSGTLDFEEFVALFASGSPFKSRLPKMVRVSIYTHIYTISPVSAA